MSTGAPVDPVAVAEKVLATPRGWSQTSVFEIKAMAGYILFQEDCASDPDQPVPTFVADGAAVGEVDPEAVRRLIAEIARAFDAFESARFSARERAARSAFKRALKALSQHFGEEICHDHG